MVKTHVVVGMVLFESIISAYRGEAERAFSDFRKYIGDFMWKGVEAYAQAREKGDVSPLEMYARSVSKNILILSRSEYLLQYKMNMSGFREVSFPFEEAFPFEMALTKVEDLYFDLLLLYDKGEDLNTARKVFNRHYTSLRRELDDVVDESFSELIHFAKRFEELCLVEVRRFRQESPSRIIWFVREYEYEMARKISKKVSEKERSAGKVIETLIKDAGGEIIMDTAFYLGSLYSRLRRAPSEESV